MAESNLSQRLKKLHEVGAELAEKEAPLLGYLASGRLKIDDHNQARLDGLITLVKSVITLRQLAHTQLRDLLLDQRSNTTAASSSGDDPKTPRGTAETSGHPDEVSSRPPSGTTQPDEPEFETQLGSIHDSVSAEMPALPKEEIEHDAELEALQREIASITQPIFDGVVGEPPERSSLLGGGATPSLADFPPFVHDLDANRSVEVEMGHRSRESNAFADTLPPNDKERDASPQNDGSQDADELFPFSAGEAGTAIFDAESLRSAGIFTSRPTIDPVQLKARFYATVISPRSSFDGLVYQLSVQEIFVKGRESLTLGEEVTVRFRVPGAKSDIECKALVREVNAPEFENYTPPSGVNLRFLNLRSAHEALIEAELKRQALL